MSTWKKNFNEHGIFGGANVKNNTPRDHNSLRAQAAAHLRRARVQEARRGRALFADAPRTGARQDRGDTANRGRAQALVDPPRAVEGHAGFGRAHARGTLGGMGDPKIPAGAGG